MPALAPTFRVRPPVSIFAAAVLVAGALACGGATTSNGSGGTGEDAGKDVQQHEGFGDAAITCGAVALVPPTVVARDANTGELLCDLIITVLSDGGERGAADASAGEGASCGGSTSYGGCPSTPPDGGSLSCVFVVFQVEGTATIQVSAPGYLPKIVPNVSSGLAGCVETPSAGTAVNVLLEPAPTHPTPAPDAG